MEEGVIKISEGLLWWKCLHSTWLILAVSLLSLYCITQVASRLPTPWCLSRYLRRENWWVGRHCTWLQDYAAEAGSLRWTQSFMVPSKCHVWFWLLCWSFHCLPFQRGSAATIFVLFVFPSQWKAHEIATITPCFATVACASKVIVADYMTCIALCAKKIIWHECYIQKQDFLADFQTSVSERLSTEIRKEYR